MTVNVKDKQVALKGFFDVYSHDVNGDMHNMSKKELLEHIGSYHPEDVDNDDDRENQNNYSPSDIFVGVASGATGIPEFEFIEFALKYFKLD